MTADRPKSPENRSQSETLGFVLVFAITIAGIALVVAFGATAMSDTEDRLSDDRAEKTLTQLDSKAALVALEDADVQRVGFATDQGERYQVDEDAGRMVVTVENRTSGNTEEILNVTMGAVVSRMDEETLAYQGGGVWRKHEDGRLMISPPEFHYRDGTLTLPAITVTGDRDLGDEAVITQEAERRVFPVPGKSNMTNPLGNHEVKVTVESDYYQGWGQYFVDRTDGKVDYDHDGNAVTATLVSPIDVEEVTAASASLSAGGEFNVSGTSASDCGSAGDVFTDSYNSNNGTYCSQWSGGPPGTEGDVVYGKDIDISDGTGGSNFYGDIASGQTVTVDDSSGAGQPDIYGNISYVEKCISDKDNDTEDCEDRIAIPDGEVKRIEDIELTDSVDWFVETSVKEFRNDSDATNPAIEGEELGAGEYYFDEIDLSTDLELNTTNGTVVLAVNESVHLDDGAEIEVTGNGHVQLYIHGQGGAANDLEMDDDSRIYNTDDNATRFRLYGTSEFDATLGGGGSGNLARYVGVIYAPPGSYGTGSVLLDGGEVLGGILTSTTTIDGGSIHYDEALQGKSIVPENANIIKVTFLHVTENRVRIENG